MTRYSSQSSVDPAHQLSAKTLIVLAFLLSLGDFPIARTDPEEISSFRFRGSLRAVWQTRRRVEGAHPKALSHSHDSR
jgi:hypothetical protein